MFVHKLAILWDTGILPAFDAVVWEIVFISASYACILDTFSTKLVTLALAEEKFTKSLNEPVE